MSQEESQSRSDEGPLSGNFLEIKWGWWSQKKLGDYVDWHPLGATSIKASAAELPKHRAEGAFTLVRDFLAGQHPDPGLTALGVRSLIERSIARYKALGGEWAEKQVSELSAMLAVSERGPSFQVFAVMRGDKLEAVELRQDKARHRRDLTHHADEVKVVPMTMQCERLDETKEG